ncbi:hypothetical protein GGF37_002244 [Kickxella alabastrina]|nr:hypothetical protein GGF37_002244 [Kickxella alabastrina]
MDALDAYINECMTEGREVKADLLVERLLSVCEEGEYKEFTAERFKVVKLFLGQLGKATITVGQALEILEKVCLRNSDSIPQRTNGVLHTSSDAEAENSNAQVVPVSSEGGSTAAGENPFDRRQRTHRPLTSYGMTGSAAEGSKLRMRNISSMNDAQYDALSNSISPHLAEEIVKHAEQKGLSPSRMSQAFAVTEPSQDTHHIVSDSDTSGMATPQVSRKALHHQLHSGSGTSPTKFIYSIPESSEVLFVDEKATTPSAGSPVRTPVSPMRPPVSNEIYIKVTDDLMAKNQDLQKKLKDRDMRMESVQAHSESTIYDLQRKLDETSAEMNTKRREIEKLRASERNYANRLKRAETEVENAAVRLSNSMAQVNEHKQKSEKNLAEIAAQKAKLEKLISDNDILKGNLNLASQQLEQANEVGDGLVLQIRELQYKLAAAQEESDAAANTERENKNLKEEIKGLHAELKEQRLKPDRVAPAGEHGQGMPQVASVSSLQDELRNHGGGDMLAVDDQLTVPNRTSDSAVREWVQLAMDKYTSEDLVIMGDVWRRIGYCDDDSCEDPENLRSKLLSVFLAPCESGLKEAIRGLRDPTLTRIVDTVAGEYKEKRAPAAGRKSNAGKGGPGIVQSMMNSEHSTTFIFLYSLVVFCVGIIIAKHFSTLPQLPLPGQFGGHNSTLAAVMKGAGDDGSMSMVRQILVVDDTPATKYYTPLGKRSSRTRIGEILFYWMETLLWEDSDAQVPT